MKMVSLCLESMILKPTSKYHELLTISIENFSKEQIEIVTGLMLGDGCIHYYRDTAKYPRLTNTRKSTDIDYLKWQYDILKDVYSSPPKEYSKFDKRTNKTYHSCYANSRAAPVFKHFYDLWYPSGKKLVPKNLVLTPLVIAVWFCDDGNMRFNNKNETSLAIKFATDGFLKEDVEFLANLLHEKYSEYFGVYKNGSGYIIKASNKAARKIALDIDTVFPNCMLRKAIWRTNEKAKEIINRNINT